MEICGFCPQGYDGQVVKVECDIQYGLPRFTIVGLPDSAVREARDRVRAAIIAVGCDFPARRILINLSPGGIRKLGSGYDLAIAAAILFMSGQLRFPIAEDARWLFLGELGLGGQIKGSALDYAALLSPQVVSFAYVIISSGLKDFAKQLPLPNVPVHTCDSLRDLCTMPSSSVKVRRENRGTLGTIISPATDTGHYLFPSDPEVYRSLEVAVAGFHNILCFGAPGSGKTTVARSMAGLLPQMDDKVFSEQLRIHFRSLSSFQEKVRGNSFREPHHSSSAEGILGGGKSLRPGEVSLAHGGVLLLDEAAEFHRHVLQNLREPMETGKIHLIRADQTTTYPCMTIFALTMNLCPCGNRGKSDSLCMCSEGQIHRYWSQLGGALYDRIEIKRFFAAQGFKDFLTPGSPEHNKIKERIWRAQERQKLRNHESSYNAYLSWERLRSLPESSPEIIQVIDEKQKKFFLSGRQRLNLLRISLTLLDLEDGARITDSHVSEALSLMRPSDYGEYF